LGTGYPEGYYLFIVDGARKGFHRIRACRQLPVLRQSLIEHCQKRKLDQIKDAA